MRSAGIQVAVLLATLVAFVPGRAPGEPEMILLAIEDATARRDAEEARREAEARGGGDGHTKRGRSPKLRSRRSALGSRR